MRPSRGLRIRSRRCRNCIRRRSPKATSTTSRRTSKRSNAVRSLHLFGRDLRLGDNAALCEAARAGEVVPALIIEAADIARLARNPRRAAYYCGAVSSLAADLDARGARLICRRGALEREVCRLARDVGAATVTFALAYDAQTLARQRELQGVLEEAGIRVTAVHDAPAIAPEETAAVRSGTEGHGYRALGPYVAAWTSLPRAPQTARIAFATCEASSDALPQCADYGAAAHAATAPSEASALRAFETFAGGPLLQYATARNVPAYEATSRLSAALSFGTISARTVLARIDERARDRFLLTEERLSLRAFTLALARRDFFLQLAWFFEDRPDTELQARMRRFPFCDDHPELEAWLTGRTGYPLVDAGIRQLHATGWMHPRARLVAAAFLCFDLGVDWRIGRDAWDRLLIEDDGALATGNWQWVAGVGADLAQFPRIYNPRKQARAFDPLGTYVKRYVAELAGAPPEAPRDAVQRRQLSFDLFDAARYPAPVVEHEAAARAFLQRYIAYAGEH